MDDAAAKLVLDLNEVGAGDVSVVGGKCASPGELLRELVPKGIRAADGFATASVTYALMPAADGFEERPREFLKGYERDDNLSLKIAMLRPT